ncbi:hypothetical protein TeGR_g14548, partial [Tetraparma gracilis]
MASKHAVDFTMPPEFPMMLREYSKELLRDKPVDIYTY